MSKQIVVPGDSPAVEVRYLEEMAGCNPQGACLRVNTRYIEREGKPWLPVMAEFQFSRYPRAYWEDELLKMRASGVDIVASYVFWIHHEEIEGQWKWDDYCDLRAFAELCAKHDLYFYPRIGPWVHGECRNGGLPDWIVDKCKHVRTDDPAYLHYVDLLYQQIGTQLTGLTYKDGGPIIGIQLENEYGHVGGLGNEAHILTLKKLALKHGMEVPLWTVTGWGGAWVPEQGVVPVLGAYPAAPWTHHVRQLDPMACFLFQSYFNDETIASDHSVMTIRKTRYDPTRYPYFTCETGGGIQVTDHRRPYLSANDVATVPFTQIGSGANLIGYYVYHGGTNPVGVNSTFQESKETGYPNDLPALSYDFQAAIGEYGELHPSLRHLKLFHQFLHDFGEDMAPMPSILPESLPNGPADMDTLRYAVRSKDGRGYVFVNNYQRHVASRTQKGVTISIPTPDGEIVTPAFDVPPDTRCLFPVNKDLGGVILRYATAQPVCKLAGDNGQLFVFSQIPGIECRFQFSDGTHVTVAVPGDYGAPVYVSEDHQVTVLLLPHQSALNLWKGTCFGEERLIITDAAVCFDQGALVLNSTHANIEFGVFPAPAGLSVDRGQMESVSGQGLFNVYRVAQQATDVAVTVTPDQRGNAYTIGFPDGLPDAVNDVFLDIDVVCDKAFLSVSGKTVADFFYFGKTWRVGLKRFSSETLAQDLKLALTPPRSTDEVYYEVRDKLPEEVSPQLRSIKTRCEYEFRLA